MQIDRIKISQEVIFLGMPTWIGMEASLLPDENEKEGLKTLQKSITDYLKEENKLPKNKWAKNFHPDAEAKPMMDMIILKKYNKAILEKDTKTLNEIKAQYHVED